MGNRLYYPLDVRIVLTYSGGMATNGKVSPPVVVTLNGRRYVLTPNGVTRVVSVPDYTPRRRSR